MTDFADLAADREQELRDDALAAHQRRQRLARASHPTADWPGLADPTPAAAAPDLCAVCDEPIPAARRAALPGVETCIDCQRELERALRLRASPPRNDHP